MQVYNVANSNNFIGKMLQAPHRQRVINLPKDGSRAGFFSERNSSKHSSNSLNSAHMQFSFNLNDYEQRTQQQINISNQIITKPEAKRTIDSLYTVNPQKTKNNQIGSINFKNSRNKQSPRKQHVHPSILQGPLIEDVSNQDLNDTQEISFQLAHANIKKVSLTQKPLKQQVLVQISSPPKKVAPIDKIQENDRKINQFKKNDSISFCNQKPRVFPSLSRMGNSEPESIMRLAKKQSDPQNSSSNLLYQTKKQDKKGLVQYGHLLPENKLSKLKNQINNIVSQKSKNKSKINYTNQTRIQDDNQLDQTEKQRPNSNFLFGSNTKNSLFETRQNKKFIFSDAFQLTGQNGRTSDYRSFSNPKSTHYGPAKKITISYKTSLNQLTQILRNVSQIQKSQIQVLVPKILMTTYFDQNMQKTNLYNHAKYLFTSLGISANNLTIKKYSNCILMVAKNICLLWHYDGKVYLGGWHIQYLDEGVKHGLGLEWVPNKYVYYGQYSESKKSGLGVLKTRQETYIGEWSQGKKTDNCHIINQNGQILHPRISYDGNARNNQLFGQQSLETDPFF